MFEIENLIFIGDIHGQFKVISEMITKMDIKRTCFIQLGDFGVGFDKKNDESYLKELNTFLESTENLLMVIRGNHDDPAFWKTDIKKRLKGHPSILKVENSSDMFGLWQERTFSNIVFVPDFTFVRMRVKKGENYKEEIYNLYFIGGGISIDRILRKEDISYWWDERINQKQLGLSHKNATLRNKGIQHFEGKYILVTHVPHFDYKNFCSDHNSLNYYKFRDPDLERDLIEEDECLNKIKTIIPYDIWISSHMHSSRRFTDKNDKKIILLDINEFLEI